MRRVLICIVGIALLWSCSNSNVSIEGKIENAENLTVYLSKLNVQGTEFIDSAKLSAKGTFKFKSNTVYPQLYTLALSNGNVITTVVQAEDKLSFEGDAKDFAVSYIVKGSDDAAKAKIIADRLLKTQEEIKNLKADFASSKISEDKLNSEIAASINRQRKFSSDFIIANATSLASYLALYQKIDDDNYTLNDNSDIYYIRVVASSLKALYPESQYTTNILASLDKMQSTLVNEKLKDIIKNAPSVLPEIMLPNINGESIKLSSLKGKYIILDFTDLSNSNSTIVNNHYKLVYEKYKSKGLVIYQVALDKNQQSWKSAISKQGLNWVNVWDKDAEGGVAVQNWNIHSIPANYIISKNFDVVGKNLFGRELEDKLTKVIR